MRRQSRLLPSGPPRILELSTATRRKLLRLTAIILSLITISLLAVACGGSADSARNGDGGDVVVTPLTQMPGSSDETPAPNGAVPEPTQDTSSVLSGFTFPIEGGCLPAGDQLMPNAPRTYRNGTHEGIDFYSVDNCTYIGVGTAVVAAKAGTVIRADTDYVELTPSRLAELQANLTSPETLDAFRGRQVWIDHGGGVVTRYAHLNEIAAGITQGVAVEAGDVIAYVGESGTPESINNPGNEYHLHFEVRVGDSYLGNGLPPQEVRALYTALFGQ